MDTTILAIRNGLTVFTGKRCCVRLILTIVILATGTSADARTIRVVSGSYGQNCGAPSGNATHDLFSRCDGRERCEYVLNSGFAAVDPSPGCQKDFLAEWRCNDTEFHRAVLSPGAGKGDELVLSCIQETGAGK